MFNVWETWCGEERVWRQGMYISSDWVYISVCVRCCSSIWTRAYYTSTTRWLHHWPRGQRSASDSSRQGHWSRSEVMIRYQHRWMQLICSAWLVTMSATYGQKWLQHWAKLAPNFTFDICKWFSSISDVQCMSFLAFMAFYVHITSLSIVRLELHLAWVRFFMIT